MVKIKISKTLEAKIKKGYPWIFKYQLQNPVSENSGSLAVLYDHKNRFLAIGIWDPDSDLCFRVLNLLEPKEINYGFFQERFQKALSLRKGLIEQGTTGYRVLNGENDGFPGLVLDKYDKTWVIKVYTKGWFEFLGRILEVIQSEKNVEQVVLRLARNIEKSDFFDGKVLFGPDSVVPVNFQENHLNFQVDVVNGQKTGFFLDQRDNRLQIKKISRGLSVLNVFSYTGGFSVYAISGGCRKLVEIDSNPWALNDSLQNLKLNFQETRNFDFQQIEGDAFQKLKELNSNNTRFDLVILDPPAFARSKKHRPQALEAYSRLAELGVQLVAEGGKLFAASCSAPVSADDFYKAVHKGVALANRKLTEITRSGHAIDHPVRFAEMEYLKSVTGWVGGKK
ncbi:MAG: class I SAM-dependent rRNA methyltransferase [Nitrospinae bacterium]|nr:class I SAM-dependent rRNA methyltransferase [Nitrospinota bacterium]MZH04916.1 class I SAM-dependent rRNA methyltransferase [Nitrospinota bacterium]MZH14256.1 class I SAM-dependent rRNA methyltransferase [Nitrospinota bacterium]